MITFQCCMKNSRPSGWAGTMDIIRSGIICELDVTARGSRFHILTGSYAGGKYICIPNWNVGTELGSLNDTFWNQERLTQYTKLNAVDACSVTSALAELSKYL